MFGRREIAVVAPPGLEPIVASELARLGWPDPRSRAGLVTCTGELEHVWRAALGCRTGSGLRVRLGSFQAHSLGELAAGTRSLKWKAFLEPGAQVEVSVTSHRSRLRRRQEIEHKMSIAIKDALRGPRRTRWRPPGQVHPQHRVYVQVENDRARISLEAAGAPLYQRGYRAEGGRAPLRENLAAAILLAAGWQPGEPLLDPFTGSGTFLLEAASMALGRLPGSRRDFIFQQWPCHQRSGWERIQRELAGAVPVSTPLVGWDAEQTALQMARRNAGKADLPPATIRWVQGRIDALQPAGQAGLLVANPPWGHRLGKDVSGVWSAFGRVLRERFTGWRLAIITPHQRQIDRLGVKLDKRLVFPHGGQRVGLYCTPSR